MESFFPEIDPPDPRGKLPWLPLIRCPAQGTLHVVVLSTAVSGVRLHRIDKKPFLCPRENCPVPGCPDVGRYEGYLEVIKVGQPDRLMLAMTGETANTVKAIACENGLTTRGLDLIFERDRPTKKSTIKVVFRGIVIHDSLIPKPRDMRPFILRLYKQK